MTDRIVTRHCGRSTWQGPESEAPPERERDRTASALDDRVSALNQGVNGDKK